MSKHCINCGEKLDNESVYCFKCKHDPNELWSPEKEDIIIKKEKKRRIAGKIVIAVIAAAVIVGVVLLVRSCTGIHRDIKYNDATVKLTKVSQVGDNVILHFEVKKSSLDKTDVKHFQEKVKVTVDDCTYSEVAYDGTGVWLSRRRSRCLLATVKCDRCRARVAAPPLPTTPKGAVGSRVCRQDSCVLRLALQNFPLTSVLKRFIRK